MKVKVVKKFRDKNTKAVYETGTVLEVTKRRYAEIMKVGALVVPVAEEQEAAESED